MCIHEFKIRKKNWEKRETKERNKDRNNKWEEKKGKKKKKEMKQCKYASRWLRERHLHLAVVLH